MYLEWPFSTRQSWDHWECLLAHSLCFFFFYAFRKVPPGWMMEKIDECRKRERLHQLCAPNLFSSKTVMVFHRIPWPATELSLSPLATQNLTRCSDDSFSPDISCVQPLYPLNGLTVLIKLEGNFGFGLRISFRSCISELCEIQNWI